MLYLYSWLNLLHKYFHEYYSFKVHPHKGNIQNQEGFVKYYFYKYSTEVNCSCNVAFYNKFVDVIVACTVTPIQIIFL